MKRATLPVTFLISLLVGLTEAQATEVGAGRNFGLGFQVGDPTAIIGKLFIGGGNAIDFGVGFGGYGVGSSWCYRNNGSRYRCGGRLGHASIHGDYLWQDNIARGTAKLDWHIGVGGRVHFWQYNDNWDDDDGDLALAVRMPLGLDLTFNRPDFLEVFFEIAPGLYFLPFVDFDVDAAIGVRFYF